MINFDNPKNQKTILITGAAGFIGAALSIKLIDKDFNIIGIDNLNNYYSVDLKLKRLNLIKDKNNNKNLWHFHEFSLENAKELNDLFNIYNPNIVINLAAQAGVRYSLENPLSYVNSNILGFLNVLEACRKYKVEHLIYASSSSVYGGNKQMPFSERNSVDHPISLYAATKKSNELMAHSYSHLFDINTTGLRFFTVYGPYGRPDMAPMIFAKAILENEEIRVFNNGDMSRDFTYIDDVIEIIYRCCLKVATKNDNFNHFDPDPSESFAPYKVFNVGSNNPISLMNFIEILENALGKKAQKIFMPMQPGDVHNTFSDISKLQDWIKYTPQTSFEDGIKRFAEWYKNYFDYSS